MAEVYLLFGSNLGDKIGNVCRALHLVGRKAARLLTISGVYETQAWGSTEGDDFINLAVLAETGLSPENLLKILKKIEKKIGRKYEQHDGNSRVIDIDILFYDDLHLELPDLIIPHPRLHLRNFTLLPLLEIAPEFIHPVLNKKIEDLAEECTDTCNVKLLGGLRR